MTETTETATEQQPNDSDVAVTTPESDGDEPTTFDRDYVQKLRSEAAESRTAARDAQTRGDALAELLLTRSIEQATAGVLHSPDDLPRSDDLYDEHGVPDLDRIRAAAEALAASKPYLGVPRGDVHQGARESTAPAPTLGQIMRGGA